MKIVMADKAFDSNDMIREIFFHSITCIAPSKLETKNYSFPIDLFMKVIRIGQLFLITTIGIHNKYL